MLFKGLDDREFQSTLPVRGATDITAGNKTATEIFQSTLPVRGATENAPIGHGERPISIHAPRAGSDGAVGMTNDVLAEFQSTLPVRGATRIGGTQKSPKAFQSTLPVRGATNNPVATCKNGLISIHAPRAGSDNIIDI